MKKRGLILSLTITAGLLLFSSISLNAQDIKEIMRKHRRGEEVININIGRMGCSILGAFIPWDEPEAKELIRSTSKINILVSERGDMPELRRDLNKYARRNRLEELISVSSQEENVKIYIIDNNKSIKQLLIVVSDGSDFVVLNMKGSYRKESVKRWIDNENFIASVSDIVR